MAHYTFIKVERDCHWNQQIRSEQALLPPTERNLRGLTYDYDVICDGIKIAKFERMTGARGYYLMDLDGIQVRMPWRDTKGALRRDDPDYNWRRIKVEAQTGFLDTVLDALEYIPTVEQIEQRHADQAAKAHRQELARIEADRVQQLKDAAPELFAALEAAIPFIGYCGAGDQQAKQRAYQAIAKATGVDLSL